MLDKLDLSTKAQELREWLGEDANSPVDIFSLANQIDGLTLVFYPLGKNISGMCVRDDKIKLTAINSTMSYGRQRFSLAHELYHLYFDDESGFHVCSKRLDPKSENEKCADQFASYCLMLSATILCSAWIILPAQVYHELQRVPYLLKDLIFSVNMFFF